VKEISTNANAVSMVAIAMPRVRIPKVHTTVPANRVFLETEGKVAKT